MAEPVAPGREEYDAFQHMLRLLSSTELAAMLDLCGVPVTHFASIYDDTPTQTAKLIVFLSPRPRELCTVTDALTGALPSQPMVVPLRRLSARLQAYLAAPIETRAPYSFIAAAGLEPPTPDLASLRPAVATVASGLSELDRAPPNSAVAALVRAFQSQLAAASDLLVLLRAYKDVHDKFHGIQVEQLGRLTRMLQSPGRDATFDEEIDALALAMGDIAEQLHGAATNIRDYGGRSAAWGDDLLLALAPLNGRARGDDAAVRLAVTRLRSILRKQLPPINRRLVEVAQNFPFDALIHLLDQAAGEAGLTAGARVRFRNGATDLRLIHDRLRTAIDVHNAWQDLDRELWDLDAEIRLVDVAALRGRWADILLPAITAVTTIEDNRWAVALTRAAEALRVALDTADIATPGSLSPPVAAFVQTVRRQFKFFDGHLLEACTSIMPLQKQLRSLSAEETIS